METMAQGEKSCEIIRKVMFESAGFNAFDLFSELREYGPSKQAELKKRDQIRKLKAEGQIPQNAKESDKIVKEKLDQLAEAEKGQKDNGNSPMRQGGDDEKPDFAGIDSKTIYCFLQLGLQEGTLKTELDMKECNFLVNLVNENQMAISYESFIDFVIP